MSEDYDIIEIKELDLNKIRPSPQDALDFKSSKGSSKIVVIGKPGSGKSFLIKSLMYEKRNLIPTALVMSGTEKTTHYFEKFVPSTMIYYDLDMMKLEDLKKKQYLVKEYLPNPWTCLVIDDCTDDPKVLNSPMFQDMYKNGRHWFMLFILSLQYCMDIKPAIRACVDGVFIMREPNIKMRKKLYENYAGIIPDFSQFCDIMDQITDDYTALYIDNMALSNDPSDCIFWYRARPMPDVFYFGSPEMWDFNEQRMNKDYQPPL